MSVGVITENRCRQLARALDPASIKVDGRNNRDRLAFVAAFSQLILYYDQNNQLAGNWQSFFLKDPSILFAAISKTDYSVYHSEFMLLKSNKLESLTLDADYANRLMPLLQNLFTKINQWFYFLGLDARANSLYIFLKKMIEEKLAGQLSLMSALQQRMCIATAGIVDAPDPTFYRAFESIWFKGQNSPFGLSFTNDTSSGTIRPLINECNRIFHSVFDVFVQVIEHAKQAFYQQESQVTPYPDTALLMAFSRLMETQQQEINQFGEKHLDFYYDRILHQSLRPAQADQAFVCLTLADKALPFNLPAGTLFKAGTYPDQSEILFGNATNIEINHAAISSVNTLYYDQTVLQPWSLYLNSIATPTQVVRNPLNEIVTWDGFGNNNGLPIQQGFAFASPMLFLQGGLRTITIDLVFKSDPSKPSPFLLTAFLNHSQCYLSTEKAWLPVVLKKPETSSSANSVQIVLQPSDPAIVAFAKNPDGFSSAWPMFKIIFDSSIDLSAPPILTSVSIKVQVEQFSHFSLANDLSPLPNKGPQPIFGPVPEVGDCFYVGSHELFAKPLSSLMLNMNWDKLPPDFSTYYEQYNQYLNLPPPNETSAGTAPATPAKLLFRNSGFKGKWSLLTSKNWQVLTCEQEPSSSTAKSKTNPPDESKTNPPDESKNKTSVALPISKQALASLEQSFRRWQPILQGIWQPLVKWIVRMYVPPILQRLWPAVLAVSRQVSGLSKMSDALQEEASDSSLLDKASLDSVSLFQQLKKTPKANLQNSSFTFKGSPICTPMPDLALAPLPALSEVSNGYIRFELETPQYGFGNSLYAQVIAYISYENAKMLIQQAKTPLTPTTPTTPTTPPTPPTPPIPAPLPNPPYSPKLSSLQGSYTACAITAIIPDGNADPKAYPLELYHYGAFKPYLAYDATGGEQGYGFCNLTPQDRGNDGTFSTLPLFPGVSGQGCLYVSFSGVVAPCTLTVFAEISADEHQVSPEQGSVGYYYWTNTGWQPIKVLRNDTHNLTCSGIITFDIPPLTPIELQLTPVEQRLTPIQQIKIEQAQIALSYLASPIMPNADFWLAIATKGKSTEKSINFKLSYLGTQAVKLTRVSTAALPKGDKPQIVANTISATFNKLAQIGKIEQPFPSFGGLPAENKNSYGGATSFYRRVSERLNNKDRSVTSIDFVDMAYAACRSVFYAKTITNTLGTVRIGLVNGYPNAQHPNAFRPVVDALDQAAIVKHITSRTSAMTKLSVFNLKHQVVKISTTLIIASQANANAMEKILNQQLRIYLSPWISSDLPQRNLAQGINDAELIRFISAQAGVISVSSLSVMVCVDVDHDTDNEADNDDESVWVSHNHHAITLITAAGGQA